MTVTELGAFFMYVEQIFGVCSIHSKTEANSTAMTMTLKNSKNDSVAQVTLRYERVEDVWLRVDKIPEPKRKEAEKALQTGRFETIVSNNG